MVNGKVYDITDYGKTVMPLDEQGLIKSGNFERIVFTLKSKCSLVEGLALE